MPLHLLDSCSYSSKAPSSELFSVPRSMYHQERFSVGFWFCLCEKVGSGARQQSAARGEGNRPMNAESLMLCGLGLNLPGQSEAAFAVFSDSSSVPLPHLGKMKSPLPCLDIKDRTKVCFERFLCLYLPR